jgi:predicted lipase
VFRGTKGYADVKTDIDEIRAELYPKNPEIKVHNGFLKQFNSIKQQLLDTINNNLNNLTAIHFSGHSLGAALATIAAGYFSPLIRLDNNIRIVCHTFGCPRLGNKGFVKWWADKVDESYRILNKHDPVPLVPVNPFYTHITGGLEISKKNKVKIINRDTAWFLRILYLPWQIKCLNPISYHHCDTYTSRLKTLANWDITLL